MMASCKNSLPQGGSDLTEVGESTGVSSSLPTSCPSYSGGGNNYSDANNELGVHTDSDFLKARVVLSDCEEPTNYSGSDISRKTVKPRTSRASNRCERGRFCKKTDSSCVQKNSGNEDVSPSAEVSSGAESTDRKSRYLKRPSLLLSVPGYLDSDDTETEGTPTAKVAAGSKGRRGKAGGSLAGPSRGGFKQPSPVTVDKDLEMALQRRKYKKAPTSADVELEIETGSDTDALSTVDNMSALNAQELRARAGKNLTCILEVARKSSNLKGEFVSHLKKSASTLGEVVDALAARSEAEETRRLRADNGRLKLELESLKAEVKALRRGFTEAKTAAATAATTAATASALAKASPATPLTADLLEEMKRSLTITFGQMLDARIAVVEERLPPAPIIRPPLRSDSKKVAATTAQFQTMAEPAPHPNPETGKRVDKASKTATTTPPAGGPSYLDVTSGASQHANNKEETWTKVVRKRQRKSKGKGGSSAPTAVPTTAPTARSSTKPRPSAPIARKTSMALRNPKSAAVVLSLQSDAAEKGVTYSDVLRVATEKISLQELGIDQLRFRQTATGARMFEISGSEHSEKADQLAQKLRVVLSEVANIARPVKSACLKIAGLDDAATTEKVAEAVANAGNCDVSLVKAGDIRQSYQGTGFIFVTCPVSVAKLLSEKGRLLVGWSSVQVVALEARPLRCFRCMELGHTRPQCTASTDRGELCFRCGGAGHKAANCQRTDPHCVVCADSGKPSGHIMGGRSCTPPKRKVVGPKNNPTAATARPTACEEEVVMSD